jgi:arginyl-tRNA synthetase
MDLHTFFIKEYLAIINNLFPTIFDTTESDYKFEYNFDSSRFHFGDLSSNVALIIAKQLKCNPLEIAEKIKLALLNIHYIDKIEIIKPGFINIFFKNEYYGIYLEKLLKNKTYYLKNKTTDDIYNIEFVSANPTGPLHIGHGRGAIIGDIIAKVLTLKSYNAKKEYYINDAGNQINKLGLSVFLRYKEECSRKEELFGEDLYQGEYIKDLAKDIFATYGATKIDDDLVWFAEYAKHELLKNIKHTLEEYHINFDTWFSEKELHNDGSIERAIRILSDKGYTYTTEDTTLWFKATLFGDEKDRVLKKNDGSWTYTAADVAYLMNKIHRGFNKIIMVLGQDHHSFKIRMHAIAEAIGFKKENLIILLYQLVTLKNSNKIIRMSKRKGNSIELEDIIDNVGSDVARFFYLHRKQDAHLEFDVTEALQQDKTNPVFYIQYALVRINSILKKYAQQRPTDDKPIDFITYPYSLEERLILKKINLFNGILDEIITNYSTHQLAFYTLELSALFHSFYMKNTIISQNYHDTEIRIAIAQATGEVLSLCAHTLGISIPEHM